MNLSLIDFFAQFPTEQACRDYLEKTRWGKRITCPKCGVIGNAYKYFDGRLYKCGDCRRQFTVRVGTIFEDSKIPLQKWFLAIYLASSLKKGISSIQLSKYLDVTQKTSWFMLHRIRHVFGSDGLLLSGEVEVDETYVGGKRSRKLGSNLDNKTSVIGMVERGGRMRAKVTNDTKSSTITPLVRKNVQIDSWVYTDEYPAYDALDRLGYYRRSVNHNQNEWRVGDAHTNTIEGFWSQLKRGIDGVYHHVSPKHLQRYCDEYAFRHNTPTLNDFARFEQWFGRIGKRLTYKELI